MGWSGGGGAPAADPNIGAAQKQLADLSTEQWNMFKSEIYPKLLEESEKARTRADEIWAQDKEISDFNLAQARKSTQRYEETAIPAMDKLKADADLYNTAGYQEQMAGQAIGDIEAAQEMSRADQAMRDRAYGIDPTSGRSAGAANANNVQYALAKASAATQTREAAKAMGLQKQANVYSMAAGLPLQSLQQSGSSVAANAAGMNAGSTAAGITAGAGSAMNSAANTAMGGWGQVGQLGVGKYNADIQRYKADSESASGLGNMFGTIAGAAIKNPAGIATLMSDIRTKQNIKPLGVLDNGFPVYAFEYKPEFKDEWGHGIHIGVMAHEVEAKLPSAVIELPSGYKAVDYAKVVNHGI
jgi:hypothetical protein